ncbi:hypothetical protein N6H13_19135 [Paenibacillus sp. CC-CFT742]|nr:hypothetical protein [Paenibacillus sp. CC-CFT742]WJH27394.1 hypothetical protein N6H13_19135 [Paenibacillus sp. CC-CFT742]
MIAVSIQSKRFEAISKKFFQFDFLPNGSFGPALTGDPLAPRQALQCTTQQAVPYKDRMDMLLGMTLKRFDIFIIVGVDSDFNLFIHFHRNKCRWQWSSL